MKTEVDDALNRDLFSTEKMKNIGPNSAIKQPNEQDKFCIVAAHFKKRVCENLVFFWSQHINMVQFTLETKKIEKKSVLMNYHMN